VIAPGGLDSLTRALAALTSKPSDNGLHGRSHRHARLLGIPKGKHPKPASGKVDLNDIVVVSKVLLAQPAEGEDEEDSGSGVVSFFLCVRYTG